VREKPPPLTLGIAAGALFVVVETLLVYLLGSAASRDALGMIFLVGVLVRLAQRRPTIGGLPEPGHAR
jgi:hypothetical protein